MKNDQTVERIRQARHEISAECGHDPGRLVAYYMQYQKRHAEKMLPSSRKHEISPASAARPA